MYIELRCNQMSEHLFIFEELVQTNLGGCPFLRIHYSMQTTSAHVADTGYLVRQTSNAGYQWASLLAPPAYIAYVTARRGRGALSLNKVLRATWVGGLSGILAWRSANLDTSLTDLL